jgi:O-methyltransferase involved in polyketide biosynthesis
MAGSVYRRGRNENNGMVRPVPKLRMRNAEYGLERSIILNSSSLDTQSAQATMLIPLWGRAKFSRQNPDILLDEEAERIIQNCGFDFSGVENSFKEFGGICYIVRARKIDDAIRRFISKHPRATVVNIGAGLDTTFSRVDNGLINWYNLDLPDAVAYRQTLIPDSPRNLCIAKSVLDETWLDDVIFKPEDGIFLVSGGVFYYLHEEDLRIIFHTMAERFPNGELYFDAESQMLVNKSNKVVQKSGNKGAMMYFSVNDARALEQWSPHIRLLSSEPPFKDISISKQWSGGTRFICRMMSFLKPMKFIHLRFIVKRTYAR